MPQKHQVVRSLTWSAPYLIISVLVGFLLAVIDGKRGWVGGWLAYSLLLLGCLLLLAGSLGGQKAERKVSWLVWGAFGLRLALGTALMALLPVFGYADSDASQAGYLYEDAWVRDTSAWQLHRSGQSLTAAFEGSNVRDQYGGMLAFSAATYRLLSPNYHRPLLVLIWLAMAGAMAVLFLWRTLRDWLPEDPPGAVAWLAALIFALYPEAVLLGSSHMRESVVLLGITLVFFAFTRLSLQRSTWILWYALGIMILLIFQVPMAFVVVVVTIGLWLLDAHRLFSWRNLAWFGGMALAAGFGAVLTWRSLPSLAQGHPMQVALDWLRYNFGFQTHLSERASGMLQSLLNLAGERLTLPVILVYGVAQPVLPATLIDPAARLWRVLNTLRAAGWYILLPMLGYACLVSLTPAAQTRRWQRIWLGLGCLVWILVAAANAGGDQWDNPRYRTLFLPWMAFLAAWGWQWARQKRDPWLWRLGALAGIFVFLFLEWYISRYSSAFPHLGLSVMIGLTAASCLLFLAGCLVWDWLKRKKHV